MKELPGTMDEALRKATQQELVEAAQRRLHKEKSHITEALAVDDTSDSMTASNVLTAAVQTRESTKQTEDVDEELSRQLQKLTEEVSQLQRRSTPVPHQADYQKQKRGDVGACWHCGERGHHRHNCLKRGGNRYRQGRSETAAVGSMVMVMGLVADRGCLWTRDLL